MEGGRSRTTMVMEATEGVRHRVAPDLVPNDFSQNIDEPAPGPAPNPDPPEPDPDPGDPGPALA